MTMNHDQPPTGKGCVPYLVVAAILAALIYGVVHFGGSGSDHGARPSPTSGALPAAQGSTQDMANGGNPGNSSPDNVMLGILHAQPGDPISDTGDDASIIRLGHTVCDSLEAGNTVGELYGAAKDIDFPAYLVPSILEASATAYCPAYTQDIVDYEIGEST